MARKETDVYAAIMDQYLGNIIKILRDGYADILEWVIGPDCASTIYNYKLLVGLIMCMKAFLLFRQEIMTQDGDMETSLKLWRQYHSILATVLTKPYLGYIKVIIIS